MPGEIVALLIPILALLIPIIAIISHHQRKMAEIKASQGPNASPQLEAELAALRREVAQLRDTATSYDMSFDAALTRLEERVERVEQSPASAAYLNRDYTQIDTTATVQTVGR